MEFREKIINYRKDAPSISSLSTKTDLFFLDKYGSTKKGGKIEISNVLFPGTILFFTYNTGSKINEKVKFINRNPLFLYLSSEKIGQDTIIKGIDLTITPPEQRLQILERFVEKFSPQIKENEKKVNNGESPNPIRVPSDDISKLFSGTGYKFSACAMSVKFMSEVKFIDYDDWHKLPYLKYSLIQGVSINEIYNEYRSKLNS